MKDLLANGWTRPSIIKADHARDYGDVEDVVDNLRAAGVDQIGLLTEQDQVRDKKPLTASGNATVTSRIQN